MTTLKLIEPPAEDPAGIKFIGTAEVLPITERSVIILRFDSPATAEQIEFVQQQWQKASGLPNRVVALANGVNVKVVEPKNE